MIVSVFKAGAALIGAASLTLAASAQGQSTDLPDRLSEFDRAVANGDDGALAQAIDAILADRDGLGSLLLPEEVADLYAAMARAAAPTDPDLALTVMGDAIHLNEDLVRQFEEMSDDAPISTLDIYAAREALYGRYLEAAELARALGRSDTEDRFSLAALLLSDAFLRPSEIQLQTMGADPAVSNAGESAMDGPGQTEEPFQIVRVFYGTNREAISENPNRAYSNDRAGLTYGIVEVSVPNNRAPGSIPRPRIGGESASLHIVLRSINRLGAAGFGGALRASIEGAESERDEVFIFVHGHTVRFDQAARQTAQLAVDLDIRDGAIFYSWPNGESVGSYQISQASVGVSSRRFATFLENVMDEVGDADIHIIAHSMGNRLLLNALERLYDPDEGPLAKHIFWASADIDADLFEESLADLGGVAEGMTAYTSARDRALQLSASLAGGHLRVGQSEPLPSIAQVITAVDTTRLSTGLTGHGDFSNSLIEDMQSVVWLSLPPQGRCILLPVELDTGSRFWRAVDDRPECSKDAFRRALWAVRMFGEEAGARIAEALERDLVPTADRADWERAQVLSEAMLQ